MTSLVAKRNTISEHRVSCVDPVSILVAKRTELQILKNFIQAGGLKKRFLVDCLPQKIETSEFQINEKFTRISSPINV